MTLEKGKLYRSTNNPRLLYKIRRLGPKQVSLRPYQLDDLTPIYGCDCSITRRRAELILVLSERQS